VRIEISHVTPPLFRLLLEIASQIPSLRAYQAGRHPKGVELVGYTDEPVVRPGLPEPVRSRFGIITKALLALAKGLLGPLAVLDVGGRPVPFDNVARLIAQRHGLEQEPAIFTIEAPEPGFKPAWHA
jgi:hypothetical protein